MRGRAGLHGVRAVYERWMTWIEKHPLIGEVLTTAAVFVGVFVPNRLFFHLSMDESLRSALFFTIVFFVGTWVRRKITTRRRRTAR
jgi:hypothetical protein